MNFLRRKQLRRTAAVGGIVVAAVVAAMMIGTGEETYTPGERTEGLTSDLSRQRPADCPPITYEDVAEAAGLTFRHFHGERSNRLPEDMGSGVALGDVDGDGWTDVFLANIAGPWGERADGFPASPATCQLYRNLGDGTFQDVTETAGLALRGMIMSPTLVDVDNDADLDLLLAGYGGCRLFRNDGALSFVDITDSAGVACGDSFWTGVAVGDYDRDGWMDLYVCGYVRYHEDLGSGGGIGHQYATDIPLQLNPSTFEAETNLLFRNRGDGTFEERAELAGVQNPGGRSLSASFADLSGDGWPDLYVANDISDNALYVNQRDGTFRDLTSQALVGDYRGAMGIAFDDYDGDQDMDLFITHWVAQENALYSNVTRDMAEAGQAPDLIFLDEADRVGLGQIALDMVGWATSFFDYDNDGRRDLFVVNGSTIPRRDDPRHLIAMPGQLFWNGGPGRGYFEVGGATGDFFREGCVGRGGACFDYDLDGDEDLLIVRHGDTALLLRNDGGNQSGCIRLRLRQPDANCFALGARVLVRHGDRTTVLWTGTQGSYLSQHAVGEIAVGLGANETVDSIEVTWPDGTVETAGPFEARRLVTWMRGQEPVATWFPGMRAQLQAGPTEVETRREFFATLRQATQARVKGQTEAAVEHYEQAMRLWPGHGDCLYYLANSMRELGHEAEALRSLRNLVDIDPMSSRGWMQIGNLYLPGGDPALDDLAAAEAAFRKARSINAEESGPLLRLGLVTLLQGELEAADQMLADAQALNHRSVEAVYFRGMIAWLQQQPEQALQFLDTAHQLSQQATVGESTSNEGDTQGGQAMLAESADPATHPLERWRSLTQRVRDPNQEFGPLLAQVVATDRE